MIKYSSGETIQGLYEEKHKILGNQQKTEELIEVSKFIIDPQNFWKMQFNNFMLIILILYVFLVPLYVSYSQKLDSDHLKMLLLFDILFMLSRVSDLLIGFRAKDGELEPRVSMVIMKNLSSDFFLELIYTFGPFFFDLNDFNSIFYFLFKFPRFNHLFNMALVINRSIDHYCKSWNVFEIKIKVEQFDILQFIVQTCNCLHLLTCT